MAKQFFIDKITECIEDTATGKIYQTDMLLVDKADLKDVLKKNGWDFPWKSYLKIPGRLIYKLVITGDPQQVIQGLVSLEIKEDFIEMHHIENALHNYGNGKQ